SLTSTRRFGHVGFQRRRTWCDARRESASITAFAADFRCVSTVGCGPGTTPKTRLSSGVWQSVRRFPSWSIRTTRTLSTPAGTSNTRQTPESLPCFGTASSWSCSGWRGLPSSSGCGDRQCPSPDGPTARPASCAKPGGPYPALSRDDCGRTADRRESNVMRCAPAPLRWLSIGLTKQQAIRKVEAAHLWAVVQYTQLRGGRHGRVVAVGMAHLLHVRGYVLPPISLQGSSVNIYVVR